MQICGHRDIDANDAEAPLPASHRDADHHRRTDADVPESRRPNARFTMTDHDNPQGTTPGTTPAEPPAWPCPHSPFLAIASVWLGAIYSLSRVQAMEIGLVGATMLLIGAPISLAAICISSLRRQYWLGLFRRQGLLYYLLSRRVLRSLFWTAWALSMSFFLLLRFHVYNSLEWAVLATTIPIFAIVFAALRRVLSKELRTDAAITEALVWSRRICPAILVMLYLGVLTYWGEMPRHASLEEAVGAHQATAEAWTGSALVREALQWNAQIDGIQEYTLSRIRAVESSWMLLATTAATAAVNLGIFYNVCLALSCFRIPRAGFAHARLTPHSFDRVFVTAAVATFLVGFIYFPLLARLDEYMATSPDPARIRTNTVRILERIDNDYYQPGTFEKLARARAEAIARASVAADRFRIEVNAAFDRLEDEGVNEYLDWYYSLPAEYGRIGMMLQGRLEQYLTEKVHETFQQSTWYHDVEAAFDAMLAAQENVRAIYDQTVSEILDENVVTGDQAAFEVALTGSLKDIVQPPFHHDTIPMAHRLATAGIAAGAGSAAAGGITFVIVQKITAKVLGKQVLKLAAKAPLKALAGKVAGAAAGGATVGSLVPGAGTAVGAIGGGLAGVVLGVTVDGALLKLEEALSREHFEQELVAAIRQARQEFNEEYFGTAEPGEVGLVGRPDGTEHPPGAGQPG